MSRRFTAYDDEGNPYEIEVIGGWKKDRGQTVEDYDTLRLTRDGSGVNDEGNGVYSCKPVGHNEWIKLYVKD